MISNLSEHVVLCGDGVLARTIAAGLIRGSRQLVVISSDEKEGNLLRARHPNVLVVSGDPTSELSLADANVLQASHLIAATDSDHDNLLITITGRAIGTELVLISCSMKVELANKMLKVGASEVVCPMVLCGEHVSSAIAQHC